MDRRIFLKQGLAAGGLGFLPFLSPCNSKANLSGERTNPGNRKPNIIYILSDNLGYGDLGCYGQKDIQTPHIDHMATEGMRFTQHYAGSTVCAPSRCTLLTGFHTGHASIRENATTPLEPSDVTIGDVAKQAGYRTAVIGKWGGGEAGSTGIPNRQGFDYFVGYLNQVHAHNYYPEFLWRNEEKITLRNIVQRKGPLVPFYQGPHGGVSTNKLDYSHDLFTKEAFNFIKTNKDHPFFLYLAYAIPHPNTQAGPDGMEVPDLGIYANKNWPKPAVGRAAMITYMDKDIGRLFQLLKELNLDDHTIVFLGSDNGPLRQNSYNPEFFNSNGGLRGVLWSHYEGGLRVPLIVRWPGKIEAGSTSDHISALWDVLPTLADIVGVEPPEGIDGISFLPALLGQPQKEHEFLYWEWYRRTGEQAIRKGKWKAVRYDVMTEPDPPLELYDLNADPKETTDIAARHPDVVAELKRLMKESHIESPNPKWKMYGEGKG